MSRHRKLAVRYVRHSSGKARAIWNDPSGNRRERQLPGLFNSSESLEAFARLQLEIAIRVEQPPAGAVGPSVVEVMAPYLRHAIDYYSPGSELEAIKVALKMLRSLYGMDPVDSFGPKKLAAVREAFVRKGWSRPYVNRQVGKIVRAIRWAVAVELAPAAVYQSLKALAPLRRGHCDAPEPEPRQPVPSEHVAVTLPFLPPHVRAIVEVMRHSGMRPSEVCKMTLDQIDRSEAVWIYRPSRHKNAHRGHHRMVALGAAAQAILIAHIEGRSLGDGEPLFSPRRQREERFAAMRANRKSKVQPSQLHRKNAKPIRLPGEWFSSEAVGHAVTKAARRAGVAAWSPYQLRHLKGMELREKFSLEHVRAALGHTHAAMSAHYAKGADVMLATEVAAATG